MHLYNNNKRILFVDLRTGGGPPVQLFAPVINLVAADLTITDSNGDFVESYNVFSNGELLCNTTEKTIKMTDYITEEGIYTISVTAKSSTLVESEISNVVEYEHTLGTPGLTYTLSSDGTHYSVSGIGTATDTDIIIASAYNGIPVTKIGDRCFRNIDFIEKVSIPKTITHIGEYVFSDCNLINTVEIPDSVIEIQTSMLRFCPSILSVTMPNKIRTLCSFMFYGSRKLTEITFMDNSELTEIETEAFGVCPSLEKITITASTPPTFVISDGVFSDCSESLKIYVPAESVDAYKAADGWSSYADRIYAIPA